MEYKNKLKQHPNNPQKNILNLACCERRPIWSVYGRAPATGVGLRGPPRCKQSHPRNDMKVPFFSLHIPDDLISRTGLQILPKPVPNGQWMCLGTFSGNLVKMLLVQCRVIQVQTCNSS